MYFEELGTDINSSWDFQEGDLALVSDADNLVQSIVNRLNCSMDSLSLYYLEYGSFLQSFFGWRKTKKTFEYMQIEIANTLKQDPRLKDFEVSVYLDDNNQVKVDLTVYLFENSDLSMSLVLGKNGVVEV